MIQSLLHNCPIEIRDLILKSSNIYVCCAFRDNLDVSGMEACNVGEILLLLATLTTELYAIVL